MIYSWHVDSNWNFLHCGHTYILSRSLDSCFGRLFVTGETVISLLLTHITSLDRERRDITHYTFILLLTCSALQLIESMKTYYLYLSIEWHDNVTVTICITLLLSKLHPPPSQPRTWLHPLISYQNWGILPEFDGRRYWLLLCLWLRYSVGTPPLPSPHISQQTCEDLKNDNQTRLD